MNGKYFWLCPGFLGQPPLASLQGLGLERFGAAHLLFMLICGWCSRQKIEHIPHACVLVEGGGLFTRKQATRALLDLIAHGLLWPFSHGYLPSPLLVQFEEPLENRVTAATPRMLSQESGLTKPGFVYFIQAGEDGAIKIGFATNVQERISTLQTGSSLLLNLRAATPGTLLRERAIQDHFRELRLHGEWFEPWPKLLVFIEKIQRGEEVSP